MTIDLSACTSGELIDRLYQLRKRERLLLVEFLQYLGEVERRNAHAEFGFDSVFTFLVQHLGFTRSAAYRRHTASRLLARFPLVRDYLIDGRLCLTTLVELRNVLEEVTLKQTLDRAAGKTEEQVRELVATLRPRPALPELIRHLPVPQPPTAAPAAEVPPPRPAAPPPPRVEPISEELRLIRITVGRDFIDDLDAVRSALSHVIPDGKVDRVLHECLRRVRRDLARRREGAAERPRPPREEPPAGRGISRAVRREVWQRDEGCCAFVGRDGRRCRSTHKLQLHHLVPFARGGAPTTANVSLRCATHNAYEADRDFGAEHMRDVRERAQDHRTASAAAAPHDPRQLWLV